MIDLQGIESNPFHTLALFEGSSVAPDAWQSKWGSNIPIAEAS